MPDSFDETQATQCLSKGLSSPCILDSALEHAIPEPGLRWLDIGCGTGRLLRSIRDKHSPRELVGIDVINWFSDDLVDDVELYIGDALPILNGLPPADRILLVETLEHMDAPWSVLRAAIALLAAGGVIVVTTPNIQTLRHRLELLCRGQLTSFRPSAPQHLSPVLPHTTEAIMRENRLTTERSYAQRDIIPRCGGRPWPVCIADHWPNLLKISVLISGRRPQ
jgi:2-polyprenyl-3-methyl-5-hydroxy-6-metoxy-1,4-benzoquinol methylase